MRRTLLAAAAVAALGVAAVTIWLVAPTTAQQPGKNGNGPSAKAAPLPVTQVYLFSSGVGYFQREGEVDGPARVDLAFQATDVNDLLKSLVLQDLGGGKVSTISYDSQDPVEKTLKSFALDLTGNPSFGQLLNQARGEKVEVTMQAAGTAQPGTMTGVIVGMESQRQPHGKDQMLDVDLLNLLCVEGIRSVKLSEVQRIRFLNPTLDSELRRALDVLASTHDTQKKLVSLNFKGEGKRTVKVGYVMEHPMWKTSYRLVISKDGKVTLHGWANVENTTDEDWSNVRMALISGRPISFQMNIYQPLHIPRPTVEPELFASLRPPAYSGAIVNPGQQQPGVAGGQLGGMMGGFQGNNPNWGLNQSGFNRYQMTNSLGNVVFPSNNDNNNLNSQQNARLTYQELQKRQKQLQDAKANARKVGSALAALDPSQSVSSMASAEEVGDYYRYVIDDKVTLPRQKSAMLAIVSQPVEATRVSIYNEQVQAKFPLLGLKFKNTSGQPLMQGPITVYEEGTYAGDSRIQDLQPKEERLLAYAIDQGTEVKAESKGSPQQLIAVKVVKGVVHATRKVRETKTYTIKNRSPQDRTLIVEHPYRSEWKLVTPQKPMEQSRDFYRFQLDVPAGKSVKHEVVEELSRVDQIGLSASDDAAVKLFLNTTVASPKLKDALRKAVELRHRLHGTQTERAAVEKQLKDITEEQVRLRANLDKVPPTSAVYKRYLEKFDTQETEIEKFQAQIKQLQAKEKEEKKEFEDYLATLTVE